MARLLALLLALCVVLPAQAWARVAELCAEPDSCCCRRDDAFDVAGAPTSTGATAERLDCCAKPCAIEAAPSPATPTRPIQVVEVAAATALPSSPAASASTLAAVPPSTRTRGPPRPRFGLVQHWLI